MTPDLYYAFRFVLGLMTVVIIALFTVRAFKRIRRERVFERRVWLGTVIYLLLLVVLLLFVSALYQFLHPPDVVPDGVLILIGTGIQFSVIIGGIILLVTWPPPPSSP